MSVVRKHIRRDTSLLVFCYSVTVERQISIKIETTHFHQLRSRRLKLHRHQCVLALVLFKMCTIFSTTVLGWDCTKVRWYYAVFDTRPWQIDCVLS